MAAFSTAIGEVGLALGAWWVWIAVSNLVIAIFSICNCSDVYNGSNVAHNGACNGGGSALSSSDVEGV
jgi:hypothetical protein